MGGSIIPTDRNPLPSRRSENTSIDQRQSSYERYQFERALLFVGVYCENLGQRNNLGFTNVDRENVRAETI
jgi:hypothetical protein